MSNVLPSTMLAVQLDAVGQPLAVRQIPVPRPGKGQVLVKMAASPVNPSDFAFMMGAYGFKHPLPLTPGNEGSGLVVAAGPGLMGKWLMGKRVACFGRPGLAGAWAEYMLTNAAHCVPLFKGVSLEQGAMSLINPLTALAFMDIIRTRKHKAFVNTAAASALGRMLIRLARREGVKLISVVRRPEQVDELLGIGAEYVLDSSSPDFPDQLQSLTHQLKATLLLDAIGGNLTQQLLSASPRSSTILSYGRMSFDPCLIDPVHLIIQGKRIEGFLLSNWLPKKNLLQVLAAVRRVQRLLGEDLQTRVRERCPLSGINRALESYQGNMSGGKVLMVANEDLIGS